MLKNFWYAVEFAHAVTRAPRRVTCLGQDFVLYRRRDGRVVCLSDLCVHRGGALSMGRLVGDDGIACPYHGWEYAPDGACTKIPANPDGRGIPRKARVDSYPVREEYGMVWAFLGDLPEEERPPIPHFPQHDDPSFRAVYFEMEIAANYERTFENVVDAAHTPFVHGTSFGNPDRPQIPDFEITGDDWSAEADILLSPPPPKGLWGLLSRTRPDTVVVTNGWYLPNIVKLHVRLPFGDLILYDHNIPLSRDRTLVKIVGYRNFFTGGWADRNALRRIEKILLQDRPIVENQRPELLPFDLADELHLRSDALQVAYRRRRRALIERGWWVGDDDTAAGDGPRRTATVIPSPARRDNPELARAWTHRARGADAPGGRTPDAPAEEETA
ncbi:aromatic ring-hydroxylating dioxygenase subunit alpha [Actinomadura kijaniata]|uniref:Phenylpropionate dioxygenase-like ring-hydroxylating dioxygenase large terminal subunit n=1 Tax=Actinomadura namibiensis TaxID=182080 RepID=A0A7W3QRK4_ACTNM|nr:aromatic ring-hydroxylating dioxygenase subunit alpha [Actinomadura namibiensis]MBA8956849.1 phenylpropionate dioxygenase-like ring-hydroxylating dioxygenase large terminal subunit [Actinomadura namibiensis]